MALPAVFLAAFWGERLSRRAPALPARFPRSAELCLWASGLWLAALYVDPVLDWRVRQAPPPAAELRRSGCESLPRCLTRPTPVWPGTDRTLALIRRHAGDRGRLAVFLEPRSTTDVLMRAGQAHAFPLTAPAYDALVPARADRIARSPHDLRPGDVLFVDRAALAEREPDPVFAPARLLLRRIVDRLCREYACRTFDRAGRVTAIRLEERPGAGLQGGCLRQLSSGGS